MFSVQGMKPTFTYRELSYYQYTRLSQELHKQNINKQKLAKFLKNREGKLKSVRVGSRKGVGDRRYRKKDIESLIKKQEK